MSCCSGDDLDVVDFEEMKYFRAFADGLCIVTDDFSWDVE